MKASVLLRAFCWLLRDTLRQAVASGIYWVLLSMCMVCIGVCLSVQVVGDVALDAAAERTEFLPAGTGVQPRQAEQEGVRVVSGYLSLGFGVMRVPLGRDRRDAVRYVQLLLAGGVADAVGLLLALVWTAGFLPTFLEASAVAVLLAKPVPRWTLLAGKYLGVLVFVGFFAVLFVGGTWLALGLRTGVWEASYLWCIPLLLVHFAIFYSFSTLLAVATRSTVTCVAGSLVFWLLCWGMNYGRHALVALPESGAAFLLVETAYWILPKPADLGILLFDTLHAEDYFGKLVEFQTVQATQAFHPVESVLSSLGFSAALLGVSAYEFSTLDY